MSIRAYRIEVPAKLAEECSFNLWKDDAIMSYLEDQDSFADRRGDEGTGEIEVGVVALEDLLESKVEMDAEALKAIRLDIEWAKENKTDYITYECF